jgi:hypothetical protein
MNATILHIEPRDAFEQPATISFASITVEIAREHAEGHDHHDCPLCREQAIPERCPGFRLEWLSA